MRVFESLTRSSTSRPLTFVSSVIISGPQKVKISGTHYKKTRNRSHTHLVRACKTWMKFGSENVHTTAYIEFFSLFRRLTYVTNKTRIKHQSIKIGPQITQSTLGCGCADMLMGLYGFVCMLSCNRCANESHASDLSKHVTYTSIYPSVTEETASGATMTVIGVSLKQLPVFRSPREHRARS